MDKLNNKIKEEMFITTRYEKLFYRSLRIRLVEEFISKIYYSDKVQSPVHLSIGQEAVAVGICESLTSKDLLFSTYRSHACYLAKGGNLNKMFAELYGKIDGISQGKAGSMHLAEPSVGLMGSSAVVASTLPHAAGAALASLNNESDQVIVCVFGDGATEEGVYHETLNFISLYKLPVILICENNNLAVHSPLKERQSYNIISHAENYGLKTKLISNGLDFLKIGDVMNNIISKMRVDREPRFIEIQTCRYKEHVGVNDDFDEGYRSNKDVEKWKAKDPLILEKKMISRFRPLIDKEIQQAHNFADNSPSPNQEYLLTDVI